MDDKPKVTPRDFFLWAGAMISLYGAVIAFITLLFSYINYVYPDKLAYYTSDPYQGGVSYEMASLIVFGILYSAISYLIRRDVARDPSRLEVWVRRWAIYLTLFAAGALIAGDLITLLMYFFNGDVTMRFLLKVATILLVAVGIFLHHFADLNAYWTRETAKARLVRGVSLILVVATIVAGFFIIGTPWQARQYRYDEQRTSDLSNIQYQVTNYYQRKQQMPSSLADLTDTLTGYSIPRDPQSGQQYEYRALGNTSFELCATFSAPERANSAMRGKTYPASLGMEGYYGDTSGDLWTHQAGHTCFTRTIDPSRYPPINPTTKGVPGSI